MTSLKNIQGGLVELKQKEEAIVRKVLGGDKLESSQGPILSNPLMNYLSKQTRAMTKPN